MMNLKIDICLWKPSSTIEDSLRQKNMFQRYLHTELFRLYHSHFYVSSNSP